MEVVNGATRADLSIREWLTEAKAAGLDTIPGTAAEILDDDVRWVLTKGKLPTAAWIEVVTTAHELGIPSSSTMMYGHVDNPAHWLAHLALLRRIQQRDRRIHRVRGAAVHPHQRADLPGRRRPRRADLRREPRGARDGPAAAARPDRQHPVLLGEARRRRHPGDAARRRQRPRRHADGGDHLPDGRLAVRLVPDGRAVEESARRSAGRRCSAPPPTVGRTPSDRPPPGSSTGWPRRPPTPRRNPMAGRRC